LRLNGGMRRAPSHLKQLLRVLLTGLGLLCVLLAFIGAFLPLVPSTPFLIVAAWCFSRSNPRLHRRLRQHSIFGPALRDWQTGRGLSAGAKVAAVVSITLAFGLSIGFVVEQPIIKILLVLFAVGLITYLLRQPTSRPLHFGKPGV
jgi:uncharacterized membrane protein YbaN (DUF454 family)